MDELNKTQVVMLVLLVSFVTSLATGIVTVTLINQAPPPITQMIGRVIEKTIETVKPGEPIHEKTIIITQEDMVMKVVKNVSSAVVSVVATKDVPVMEEYFSSPFKNLPQGFFPDIKIPQYRQKGTEKKRVSSGSGFFISKDGLILTNKHVVADPKAEYSVIMNDGRKLAAKVLVRDPFQDIAILKVEGKEFNYIPLGDSRKIKVGQSAIAIGNSLGEFQNTVSVGIISGLKRRVMVVGDAITGAEELQELIQTDASINPGNSGGPLLDLSGNVVGINTAMAELAENIGFALPINIAKRDIKDIQEFGTVKYPFIGIRYQSVNTEIKIKNKLPVDYGLLLTRGPKGEPSITKDSPAEKAGLKKGDVILEVNGIKMHDSNSLISLLNKLRVGDKIKMKIFRNGKKMELSVTLKERPEKQ